MLQPRSYPELLGKALVLEAEPFVTMVDDDNPWVEGLFLIVSVGVLIGAAQFIGGLLLTASLPPVAALEATLNATLRQLGFGAPALQEALGNLWSALAWVTGYGAGWSRLLLLVAMPLVLIIQWLFAGLIGHGFARLFGGTGSLNQTLGASALLVAPNLLLLFSAVPFVNVSVLLMAIWSTLIIYRAIAVSHDLSWQKAVWIALTPLAAGLLLALLFSALFGIGITVWRV